MSAASLAPILDFVLRERGWPQQPALDGLARRLPAVPAAGIEVRLRGDADIDLQQLLRGRRDVDRLLHFCRHNDDSVWARLDPRSIEVLFADGLAEEVWLEVDAAAQVPPPLSIFVRIGRHAADDSLARCLRVIDLAGAKAPPHQKEALARAIGALKGGAHVSHLGLMHGRMGAPMRLVIDGIPPEDIHAYLHAADWPGPAVEAEKCAEPLFVDSDRIRLALTLGEALEPDIGFECFVGRPRVREPRWRGLLDSLAAMGLAEPAICARILDWPQVLLPSTARSPWPERLIVDDLIRGKSQAAWIDCRISHVKVTRDPAGDLHAKAYIGFVEITDSDGDKEVEAAGLAADEPGSVISAPRSGPGSRTLADACSAALNFLLKARTQAGWWLDYDGFREGISDEWVTAYVAHALTESDAETARAAAGRAWRLLCARCRDRAGWGWNHVEPADADSTVWGLRLAQRLGEADSAVARRALDFLHSHIGSDGGLATYRQDHHRSWSEGREVNPGWFGDHTCVTAAAAAVRDLGPETRAHLAARQRDDGAWAGYWWPTPNYTTALAAEALIETAPERVRRAARWAREQLDQASTAGALSEAFDVALALRTATLDPATGPDRIAPALRWLLDAQCDDGSWPASAILVIPNLRGDSVLALDEQRIFTTATVLGTLHKMQRSGIAQ